MQYFVFFTLIAVLGGINYYLAHHLWQWLHCFIPRLSVGVSFAVCAALTVLMVLSVLKPFGGILQRGISAVGVCWMGVFVYLLLFFLVSDLIVLIPWLFRLLHAAALAKLRLAVGIGATALALAVSLFGVLHARTLHTVEYEVQLASPALSGMMVVVISDVHLGAMGSEARLEKIVAEINAQDPDLVCIAGDFFDTDFRSIADPDKAIETMKTIRSRFGVYACLGNHDAGKTFADMEDFLVRANVTLLKDAYTVIDGRIVLVGRLDPTPIGGAGGLSRGEFAAILEGAPQELPVVVLDHNPASVDSYGGEADLILSGHTHRGQIFPGSLITNAMYTVDYGYHRTENGVQVIVTSGAGIWGLPMRVGSDCEIVSIRLKGGNGDESNGLLSQ